MPDSIRNLKIHRKRRCPVALPRIISSYVVLWRSSFGDTSSWLTFDIISLDVERIVGVCKDRLFADRVRSKIYIESNFNDQIIVR